MVKLEVITREDGPTDWVSYIVVVEKADNTLRVCLDDLDCWYIFVNCETVRLW